MDKIYLEEYLKAPPSYFAPTSSLLRNIQNEWLLERLGLSNYIAFKFFAFAFVSPLHASLVRLQLLKFAPPLQIHKSTEKIDDLSLSSKSEQTFKARQMNLLPIEGSLHKNPSLTGCLLWQLQSKGILSLWKGHLIWALHRLVHEHGISPISGVVSSFFPQAAFGNSNWPFASVDSEHFIFIVSCSLLRMLTTPLEVLWIRSIASEDEASGCTRILKDTLESEGLEGLFPFPWFTVSCSVLTAISQVLPHILLDAYLGSSSMMNGNQFGVFVAKQLFLLGSLCIRVPLDVVRRRLYSQNVYYSRELVSSNPGLLSCIKGMVFEEGIGAFFRGFSNYWLIEIGKELSNCLYTLGEYSGDGWNGH